MTTLNTCQLKQTYFVSQVNGDIETKQHLQNLGFVKNARVALMNHDKSNGVILVHNSRIALDNTILDNITVSQTMIGNEQFTTLSTVAPGQTALVLGISVGKDSNSPLKRRLLDMGVTRGTRIYVRKVAPFGDPMELHVRGYELTLRKSEAEKVEVSVLEND